MASEKIVAVQNLNHFFGPARLKQQVLRSVNMEIFGGEIVLLVGPSGSGKTTLVSLIAALRRARDGSLKVFDSELCGADQRLLLQTRRHIGFVFQHHNLLKFLTVKQNVQVAMQVHEGISKREMDSRAKNMLDRVGLKDRLKYFPDELSGGQKQRVAIARALVAEPKLIVADEPTSSLDSRTGSEIMELLRSLATQSNAAIILVTHDVRVMNSADRVLYMEDGSLSSLPDFDPFQGASRNAGSLIALPDARF